MHPQGSQFFRFDIEAQVSQELASLLRLGPLLWEILDLPVIRYNCWLQSWLVRGEFWSVHLSKQGVKINMDRHRAWRNTPKQSLCFSMLFQALLRWVSFRFVFQKQRARTFERHIKTKLEINEVSYWTLDVLGAHLLSLSRIQDMFQS